MTTPTPPAAAPQKRYGRAGRNLPAAIASGIFLLALVAGSLYFWKPAFIFVVAAAMAVAIWEMEQGFKAKGIDLPREPLQVGGMVMVFVAFLWGAPAQVSATAITALLIMFWLLHRGVDGYLRDTSASIFTLIYLPFLGSFVGLMLREDGTNGSLGVLTFILVTVASDTGGYAAGVIFGKHPMAPVISPKKSWEGFAGSAIFCVAAGWLTVVYLLDGDWWVGVVLGLIVVVFATLGDLVESVIKRDLGIKDMSHIIPGHGGLMDRLDSLLATIAPTWMVLHYLVF